MTTLAMASRFNSMTTRVFSSDSSRTARDVGDDLLVDQLGDALDQHGAVHVVRDFGDDDLLAPALELFDAHLAAHLEAASAGGEVVLDRLDSANHAAGGEVRPFDELHQLLDGDVRIVYLGANAVHHLAQVVRGHVGGHADGDAGAAVDQQVGKGRREDGRLGAGLVVVGDEIHRVLVHVQHAGPRPGGSCGPRCSAWRRGDRPRPSRNCPGRPPAVRAWPRAGPCGRGWDKSPPRRGDDNCRWCRRRFWRTCGAGGSGKSDRSCMANRMRRCEGFNPSRASGRAREMMTDIE